MRIPGPDEDQLLAYYNYKKFYSIILLAIVDNKGFFRWTCSGCPGACADSGVLQGTALLRRAQAELTMPAAERTLFVDDFCILGDSAFSESPWMWTPYTMPVTRAERYFNFKHSSMRMRVEHAFGMLKMKFLCLQRGLLFKLEDCPLIIDTCCVLHNFFKKHEGAWSSYQPLHDAPTRNGTGRAAGADPGASGRAAETAYLAGSFLQRDWGAPGSMADRRRARRESAWLTEAQAS